MTGSFIGMNESLAGGPVNRRGSSLIGSSSGGLVAISNESDRFFNSAAHRGTTAGIMLAVLFRLPYAFFCLKGVRQVRTPE